MKKMKMIMFTAVMVLSLCGCTKEVEDEVKIINVNGQEVTGLFTGILENNVATGQGEFKVAIDDTSSWIYKGEFAEDKISGKGTIKGYPLALIHDGEQIRGLYTGNMENGKVSGEGSFIDTEENITFEYSGNWLDGLLFGKGHLTYDKYIVHFKDLDRTGEYMGEVFDGLANGEGTFSAVTNDDIPYTYTGSWKNGLFHGNGVQKYDSDAYYDWIGNFTDGEFNPSGLELLQSFGTLSGTPFTVNDKSESFIEAHPDFFVTEDTTILEPFVDSGLQYKHLEKAPQQFGDKLIKISKYTVLNIWEDEYFGTTITIMLITDRNYNEYYWVIYPGATPNIYLNSKVTLYALPIDGSSYEMVSGGTNRCYVLYGCYVK